MDSEQSPVLNLPSQIINYCLVFQGQTSNIPTQNLLKTGEKNKPWEHQTTQLMGSKIPNGQ
jgi:hypothetical protein